MGLRVQTIRIISLTVGGTVIGLYLVARLFFLSNFVNIERSMVVEDVHRAQNALQMTVSRIALLATDWATWDDAYAFMQSGNQSFVASNLTLETFTKQQLAVIALFDLSGHLVAGHQFDGATREFVPLAREITDLFTPGAGLLLSAEDEEGRQGLVMLPQGPLLLAVYPILDSDHGGPARGTLVMGAWLDERGISTLSSETLLDIRFRGRNAPGAPAAPAGGERRGGDAVVTTPPEYADTIRGYGLVRDVFGQPAFWLEVETQRDFFTQGRRLVLYSLGLFLTAGALLYVVLLHFLERRIVRRVRVLNDQSGQIAKSATSRRIYLPGPDELGQLAATLNAMLDRLDASRRALETSEKRYRALFEGIGAATILVGADQTIELANAAFVRLAGLDRAILEGGRLWTDFFPAETIRELRGEDWRQSAGRTMQTPFLGHDGETRHVYLTMALLPAEGARLVSLIDNTAGRQAEEALAALSRRLEERVAARTEEVRAKARELEAANMRLKELDQVKSTILASVSHELRTPLTSILGFTNLIERDFEKLVAVLARHGLDVHPRTGRIRQNLRIIMEENHRLTSLVNDFLDLSKIESGKAQWRDAPIDARELADRAERATAALFEGIGGVAFAADVAVGTPALVADLDRMLQVCINLIGNARKFTLAGEVRLRIGLTADGDWELRVSDTGVGIAREHIEGIFDSFTQVVAGDETDRPRGTGLGLTICRNIVEHYGGKIGVESEPGKGSVFFVILPHDRLVSNQAPTSSR